MSRRRLPIAEWETVRRLRIACFGLALCIMDWAMNTFVILCDYMMSRVFVKFAKPLCILELLMIPQMVSYPPCAVASHIELET
jgi:hypothetical protein